MSNPYEQNNPGQQQPGFGQPPQFGQQAPQYGQAPQQPGYGEAPQFGQTPQFGQQAPAQPQQPGFGQPQDAYGQPQAPFGQQPTGEAPAWGQGAPQQPTMPYGYQGTPMPPAKASRGGGAAAAFFLRSALGRLVIFVVLAGGVAAYHFATSHPAQRTNSGQVSQAGSMQASDLKVGDCFDNPSADSNISSITAIPCTQAHDSQVFAEPSVKESSYPGDSTLSDEASTDCNDTGTQNSIAADAPESLQVSALYAQDSESFDNGNDYITCFIVSDSKNLTKSYVDAG